MKENILFLLEIAAAIMAVILFYGNKKRRKQFKKSLKEIKEDMSISKPTAKKYMSYLDDIMCGLLIVIVPLGLFLSLIIYINLEAQGLVFKGIFGFMLMSLSTVVYAFINYRLAAKSMQKA